VRLPVTVTLRYPIDAVDREGDVHRMHRINRKGRPVNVHDLSVSTADGGRSRMILIKRCVA